MFLYPGIGQWNSILAHQKGTQLLLLSTTTSSSFSKPCTGHLQQPQQSPQQCSCSLYLANNGMLATQPQLRQKDPNLGFLDKVVEQLFQQLNTDKRHARISERSFLITKVISRARYDMSWQGQIYKMPGKSPRYSGKTLLAKQAATCTMHPTADKILSSIL